MVKKVKRLHKMIIVASMIALLGSDLVAVIQPSLYADAAIDEVMKSTIVEDFEDGINDVKFNPKRMFIEGTTHQLETDPKYVRNGNSSLKINYDMIGIVDNPSQIEIGYTSGHMPISGYPTKVGMWVYGNNEGHLITTKFREQSGSGSSFQAEFYGDDDEGINWTGWKYIEADIPQGKVGPIILELFFQLKQSDMSKKNKGSIWVDDIRFIYEDVVEDNGVPTITAISPLEDEVLTEAIEELQIELIDTYTGLDLDTLSVQLDEEDITDSVSFSAELGLLTYPGEHLDAGYHEITVEIQDNEGNPAGKSYTFTINAGERFTMTAEAEAVSNENYAVNVSIADYENANEGTFELKYDANTLDAENITAANGVELISDIDHINGIVYVETSDITSATARELVTVNFRVNSQAELARGEYYKLITMGNSSLSTPEMTTRSPLGSPIKYTIAFPYHLVMTGVGFGTASTMTVTDRLGNPARDVDIYFNGLLYERSVLTIMNDSVNVYEDDDMESEVLMTINSGDRYYASTEPDDGWYEIIFADGETTGYIEESAAMVQLLNESLGTTDENGQLITDVITLALGTYQIQAKNTREQSKMNSKVLNYEVVEQYGTAAPEYIQSYVAEDMSTQLSAAWQTNSDTEKTSIQYIKQSDWGTNVEPNASLVTTQEAESELQVLSMEEKGSKGEIRFHNVLVENLSQSTMYMYRVGYEGHWSEWYQYSTIDRVDRTPTSFLFITDSHTKTDNGLETYQQLMSNALELYPDTQFVMHGGDMIDAGGAYGEWQQFWQATSVYATSLPTALTLGNHDVKSEGKEVFTKGANFPKNGPASHLQYAYSYDVDNTHFVVLNSEGTEEQMIEQATWLEDDLSNNKKKWTVVMFHRPAYHTEDGRSTLVEYTQTYFAPILEGKKVDLVLVGHDHVYSRTYPMVDGQPNKASKSGTIYLDGGASGWKFYDGSQYEYLEYMYDVDVPVYSAITISANQISVEARNVEGDIVDEFSIVKKTSTSVPDQTTDTEPEVVPPATNTNGHIVTNDEIAAARKLQKLVVQLGNNQQVTFAGEALNQLLLNYSSDQPLSVSMNDESEDNQQDYVLALTTVQKSATAVGQPFKVEAKLGDTATELMYMLSLDEQLSTYTNLYEVSGDGSLTLIRANVAVNKDSIELVTGHTYVLMEIITNYNDIATTHWAYQYIQMLSAANIVNGKSNQSFDPNASVTRAEFVAMLVRGLGLSADEAVQFGDIKADAWYADAVAAAIQAGITTGDHNQRFNPIASISRQEMAVFIDRAYAFATGKPLSTGTTASFIDANDAKEWSIDAIANMQKLGIMQGDDKGYFMPERPASRAEAAKVIAQLFTLQ